MDYSCYQVNKRSFFLLLFAEVNLKKIKVMVFRKGGHQNFRKVRNMVLQR